MDLQQNLDVEVEIETALGICIDIIDRPPAEYRLVKLAVQSLVHLSACRKHLRPIVMLKILQLIQQPHIYRSNPRRFAVRSIGQLTYYDEELLAPSLSLLTQLVHRESERSQYVRKAGNDLQFSLNFTLEAFCALSRIGRRYPHVQDSILPLFSDYYNKPSTKESVRWGILIGWGRLAQSNSLLRAQIASEWIKCCRSHSFRMRWAGIKGLGHACCATGDVVNDEVLEKKCFELANELLANGGVDNIEKLSRDGEDPWTQEQIYLVQYAAVGALGLLLRSNPDKWWSKIAPIFYEVLKNPRYAAMVKAIVLLTFGKLSYYMSKDNPYNQVVINLLLDLSKHNNVLLSEPAVYSMVNFALSHEELYGQVKQIVLEKLGGGLANASQEQLFFYLKTYCKLIGCHHSGYRPTLSHCASVVSLHRDVLLPEFHDNSIVSPGFEQPTKTDSKTDTKDSESSATESEAAIAQDSSKLLELCTGFSTPVLESIVMLLKEASLWDNTQFLQNLKVLIQTYKLKDSQLGNEVDQTGLLKVYRELYKMDLLQKENAVVIMKYPEILDNPLWISNMKFIVANANELKTYLQQVNFPGNFLNNINKQTITNATPTPSNVTPPAAIVPVKAAPAPRDPRLAAKAAMSQNNSNSSNARITSNSSNTSNSNTSQTSKNATTQSQQQSQQQESKSLPSLPPPPLLPVKSNPTVETAAESESSDASDSDDDDDEAGEIDEGEVKTPEEHPSTEAESVIPSLPVPKYQTSSNVLQQSIAASQKTTTKDSHKKRKKKKKRKEKSKDETQRDGEVKKEQQRVEEKESSSLFNIFAKESLYASDVVDSLLPGADEYQQRERDEQEKKKRKQSDKDKKRDEQKSKRRKKNKDKEQNKQREKKEKPPDPCKFWLAGACKKGAECPFAHIGEPQRKGEICKFFKSGMCLKGESCIYSHDLKVELCKYFLDGKCHLGDQCRFGHFYPEGYVRPASSLATRPPMVALQQDGISAPPDLSLYPPPILQPIVEPQLNVHQQQRQQQFQPQLPITQPQYQHFQHQPQPQQFQPQQHQPQLQQSQPQPFQQFQPQQHQPQLQPQQPFQQFPPQQQFQQFQPQPQFQQQMHQYQTHPQSQQLQAQQYQQYQTLPQPQHVQYPPQQFQPQQPQFYQTQQRQYPQQQEDAFVLEGGYLDSLFQPRQ